MSLKVAEIIRKIEEWVPGKYAVKNDKIGLLTGSRNQEVKKILVSLDLNQDVLEEAIDQGVDMIFTHHNPFYSSLTSFSSDSPKGCLLKGLIKNDIALYVAHTNLDSAHGGVNDVLADLLNLKNTSILSPGWREKYIKLAVNLPRNYEDKIRKALAEAGAGHTGNYSECTFHIGGQGYFKPLQGTEPFLGKLEELTKVDEVKIETIVSSEKLENVLKALLEVHPYEEPAYDIIPLYNDGKKVGLGKIGYLQEPVSLREFLSKVKEVLHVDFLKHTGNLDSLVYKIALCGGSGMDFYQEALQKGADLYLTGDVKYHDAQDASDLGLIIVDAGHYGSERPVVEKVSKFLQLNFVNEVEVLVSKINTNPFVYFKG